MKEKQPGSNIHLPAQSAARARKRRRTRCATVRKVGEQKGRAMAVGG
jgi:hypothetical protein